MAIGAEIPFGWSVRSRRAIDDRFITADLTTRDALSEFRRHKNLEVFVESTNRSYYIDNDTTNSDWMEVLKSIDVLTEDSGITDDDFLVWFDENEKTHKKIKKSDFGGSKWSAGTGDDIFRSSGNVGIGVNPTSGNKLHLRLSPTGNNFDFRVRENTFSGGSGIEVAFGDFTAAQTIRMAHNPSSPFLMSSGGFFVYLSNSFGSGFQFSNSALRWVGTDRSITSETDRFVFQRGIGVSRASAGSGEAITILTAIANQTDLFLRDIPTSDPLVANKVWSNGGVLTLSAG